MVNYLTKMQSHSDLGQQYDSHMSIPIDTQETLDPPSLGSAQTASSPTGFVPIANTFSRHLSGSSSMESPAAVLVDDTYL